MSIVDAQGAVVASYEYDPYGNLISDEPAENTVGHLNPIRYRGYYYDSESELYYLQSRYYDPELGRFLNADTFVSTGQGLLGNNMFAYCLNNPIVYSDVSGAFPWVVFGILAAFTIIGIIVGACMDTPLGPEEPKPQEDPQKNTMIIQPSSKPKHCPPYALDHKPVSIDEGIIDSNINSDSQNVDQPTLENTSTTLTTGQRIANAAVGGAIGLMVGGAIVLTGGAVCCILVGPATTIGFLGMSGIQMVSWGILAYDVFPIFVAPFYGMEMEPLELTP